MKIALTSRNWNWMIDLSTKAVSPFVASVELIGVRSEKSTSRAATSMATSQRFAFITGAESVKSRCMVYRMARRSSELSSISSNRLIGLEHAHIRRPRNLLRGCHH